MIALTLVLLASTADVEPIPWPEARKVVEAMAPEALPDALRGRSAQEREASWPKWVGARDQEIRERILLGTEDSIAHFLLFGTSFTGEPRLTAVDLAATAGDLSLLRRRLAGRLRDLVAALASADGNERIRFVRGFLLSRGLEAKSAASREALGVYLVDNLSRVLRENDSLARALEAARSLGNPSAEFAERSRLFRSRGLSTDTSLFPNLAIEEALQALRDRGLLTAGSVRRAAIVGPGLDFADKQDGYDFYPQQSLQPFALADSLLRLGLSRADDLTLVSLDLNPQVNHHLESAASAARRGAGAYVLQLPRDLGVAWTADAEGYWARFGDAAGVPETPLPAPKEAGAVRSRAVRVRPELVAKLQVRDANVVLQRPRPSAGAELDLIVATNILVYYDVFEQCLALANAGAMLRTGGFLLSNNAILELPGSAMRSVGYNTTAYSSREADGDHVVWYRKLIVD